MNTDLSIDDPTRYRRRDAILNGVRWQLIDEGAGPLLVLLHGFPYLAYEFRHQIPALVHAGYRVLVPDLPGFGNSEAPTALARYTLPALVADLVALLDDAGARTAVLIGHDAGAHIAFAALQLRPDRFSAAAFLATPPTVRPPVTPSASWAALQQRSGRRFYQDYFAKAADAAAVLDADIARSLRAMMFSVSGSAHGAQRWQLDFPPEADVLSTVHDPGTLPDWLSPMALATYVAGYARGFDAPLNLYRTRDLSWEMTPFLAGQAPAQPACFIGGADDPSRPWFQPTYDQLETTLPNLRSKCLLDGVGHGLVEEAPAEVAACLHDFLATLPRAAY